MVEKLRFGLTVGLVVLLVFLMVFGFWGFSSYNTLISRQAVDRIAFTVLAFWALGVLVLGSIINWVQ